MKQSWAEFEKAGPVVPGYSARYTGGKDLSVVLSLLVRREPDRALEIATAYGHTSVALARAHPKTHVYTFDVCRELGGYDAHSPFAHEVLPEAEVGSVIRALEDGSVKERIHFKVLQGGAIPLEVRLNAPYSFAFVDGDHAWRRVVNDTKLALETLADDGVIVWDDNWEHCPEVMHLIDVLNRRAGDSILHVEGTRVCYSVLTKEKRARLRSAMDDL